MSPAELRRRRVYRVGDLTPSGQVLRESVAASQVLDRAVEAAEFDRSRAASAADPTASGGQRRAALDRPPPGGGTGLALGWHGSGFTGGGERVLASVAAVEVTAAGRVRGLADSTEIGQGSRTVLAQLAAEPWASRSRQRRSRRKTRDRAEQRADGRIADDDGRRRTPGHRRGPATGDVEARTPDLRRNIDWRLPPTGPCGRKVRRLPGDQLGRSTHLGDAYPCYS